MKFNTIEQLEKELTKFVEAKHKSIDEHTSALEEARASKAAAEAAAAAAVKNDDINAYRKAMAASNDADFYIKLHTEKLAQLNTPDPEQPTAKEVKHLLIENITQRDEVEIRKMYEHSDAILTMGQRASDNVLKCRNLYRAYCSEVLCTAPELLRGVEAEANTIVSRAVGVAQKAVETVPGYKEHRGMKPGENFINTEEPKGGKA